jgi:SAM-dependent methyltransferase
VSAFKDHFSENSGAYANYRPTYPGPLVDLLAEASPGTGLALDCGCGTGQLSVLLAERFARVIAIDASAKQIEAAAAHPRVEYRLAAAEASGLPDASADLVVAAQAAHWFDLPAFYAEAGRVAKARGIVALVTYGVIEMEPPVEAIVQHLYWKVAGPPWPPERRHVEEGYRSFDFPFEEFAAPPLAIAVSWNYGDLTGYVDTWSSVKAVEKVGREPIERFRRELGAVWGDPELRRAVRFPLSLRVGRVAA